MRKLKQIALVAATVGVTLAATGVDARQGEEKGRAGGQENAILEIGDKLANNPNSLSREIACYVPPLPEYEKDIADERRLISELIASIDPEFVNDKLLEKANANLEGWRHTCDVAASAAKEAAKMEETRQIRWQAIADAYRLFKAEYLECRATGSLLQCRDKLGEVLKAIKILDSGACGASYLAKRAVGFCDADTGTSREMASKLRKLIRLSAKIAKMKSAGGKGSQ